MTSEQLEESARELFNQSLEIVGPQIARISWFYDRNPDKRKDAQRFKGHPMVMALKGPRDNLRYFTLEQAELYTDEVTRQRWPGAPRRKPTDPLPRSAAIEQLDPAEAICFNSRGQLLLFIHTQGAANIMISELQEIDRFGDHFGTTDIKAGKVGGLLGLTDRETAQTSVFNFRGQRALLLSAGVAGISDQELAELEEFLLSPPDPDKTL